MICAASGLKCKRLSRRGPTGGWMRFRNAALLTVICLAPALRCFQQDSVSAEYLARMEWGHIDLSPHGTTGGLCAIVWTDGRIHAERRVQTLPSPRATVQVYDWTMDPSDVMKLQQLLASEDTRKLPGFRPKPLTEHVFAVYSFTVDIPRPDGVQYAGFEQFRRLGPTRAPTNQLLDVHPKSQMALQPLLDWLHTVVETGREDINPEGKATFCSATQK